MTDFTNNSLENVRKFSLCVEEINKLRQLDYPKDAYCKTRF